MNHKPSYSARDAELFLTAITAVLAIVTMLALSSIITGSNGAWTAAVTVLVGAPLVGAAFIAVSAMKRADDTTIEQDY